MNTDTIQWETYRFPVTGGLDTKSASSATGPDKLQVLQNGEFTKRGSVRKRRGYAAVDNIADNGALVGTGRGVVSRRKELVRVNDQRLYSKTKRNQYQDRGPFCSTTRTSDDVAQTSQDQLFPCMAQVNGYTVYVWQEAPNLLKYSVEDDSGTVYVHDAILASVTCSNPGAVAVGNSLLVTYVDTSTNSLMVKSISTADVVTSIGDAPIERLSDVDFLYAMVDGYIMWATDGTGAAGAGIGLGHLSSAGVVTGIVNVTADTPDNLALALSDDALCAAWIAVPDASYTVYDLDLTVLDTETEFEPDGVTIAVAPHDDTFAVAVERDAVTEDLHTVQVYIGSDSVIVERAYIASGGFNLDGRGMFVFGFQSRTGLQNSYFLYDAVGNCLGSLANGIASDRPAAFCPSLMSNGGLVLSTRRSLDVDQFEAQFAHNGIRRYDFDVEAPVSSAEHGDSVYLAGSQLWLYDGVSGVEAGFHLFPDVKVGTTTAATSFNDFGTVDNAAHNLDTEVQYNYRFYYEWYTVGGERIRSLALQRSFTPSFASGKGKITIFIPALTHTLKRSDANFPRGDISIVVYRSPGNLANVFSRVSSPNPLITGDNGYLVNSGTGVTFTDNLADSDLNSREQDLESILELKHVSPPAPNRIVGTGTRIFIAGGEVEEGTVLASKRRNPGETCQFAGELSVLVAPDEITDMGTVDDSLVCFTRDSLYLVTGDMDNVGGGEFQSELITTDVGCTEPGSVAIFPQGLMFKSAKGIYAVSRGGEVSYIGEFVESYNSQVVRDARMIPDTNQVVFVCEDGSTLMYDYHYGQWGTYTNHLGVSACATEDGQYAYLRTDGTVFVRNTSHTDNGSPYTMKIRTGNFTFEAGQLYWRLRRVGILGEYVTPHKLRVGVYHNRDPFPRETAVWDPLLVIDTGLWGAEALWGTSLARWGGSIGGTDYQFFRRVRNQKAQQVRFEFEDIITSEAGASYELTELLLEVGVMPGPARVSPGRKV